ncbi:MAG: nitrilase-related carbon-nitrogen hydrolase [Gemmatales bacterium]
MNAMPLGASRRQLGWMILAGGLTAAAFPPLGAYPLILVSMAMFIWLLRDLDQQTARNLGVVYGLTLGLGTMYWFFVVFTFKALPLIFLMALYFALLAQCIAMTRGMSALWRILITAACAVGIEWLRGDAWYLRFPWYNAPHALAQEPFFIAPVRWLGAYGFSFVLWVITAAGVFWKPWAWLALPLLFAAGFLLPAFDAPNLKVLLVQAEEEQNLEPLIETIPTERVDLVVMPEYAFHRSVKSALASPKGPKAVALRTHAPVVFGAVDGGEYGTLNFFNVAVVIDADGKELGTFPKQHPVPMMLDGKPGDRRPVFSIPGGVLGVSVCYDNDAPEVDASLVRAGATVLVAPTFDALWWTHIQHVHHELLTRLRAVENDRWLLRAVSSGRSEVIDPHGHPSKEGIPIGEKGIFTLPFAHRTTFALGGQLFWIGPVLFGILIGFVLIRGLLLWKMKQTGCFRE